MGFWKICDGWICMQKLETLLICAGWLSHGILSINDRVTIVSLEDISERWSHFWHLIASINIPKVSFLLGWLLQMPVCELLVQWIFRRPLIVGYQLGHVDIPVNGKNNQKEPRLCLEMMEGHRTWGKKNIRGRGELTRKPTLTTLICCKWNKFASLETNVNHYAVMQRISVLDKSCTILLWFPAMLQSQMFFLRSPKLQK